LAKSNIILNDKIPKEKMNKENMLTITSVLDGNKKLTKIKKINIKNVSYNPRFNNIFLPEKMKLTINENSCNKSNENKHSPKSGSNRGITFKFKKDIHPRKMFNHFYGFNNRYFKNFINKTIYKNSKNSMNSINNKIKNMNKTYHIINNNNYKKDIMFKRNNTIEYENENEYKSIFNHCKNSSRIKNSSFNRKKIIQSNNNNSNIKNTIKNNHIFLHKAIGRNNIINLMIPSNISDESNFKLCNSFNQNKELYNFSNNSIINYLGNISNSFDSYIIKDSFNSVGGSLNKNKNKSKNGIIKNKLYSKCSFNNLNINNNKIISHFNGMYNTLNTEKKINKKQYLYHTPLSVIKTLKKENK
jgi:hypothetical protein